MSKRLDDDIVQLEPRRFAQDAQKTGAAFPQQHVPELLNPRADLGADGEQGNVAGLHEFFQKVIAVGDESGEVFRTYEVDLVDDEEKLACECARIAKEFNLDFVDGRIDRQHKDDRIAFAYERVGRFRIVLVK